MDTPNTSPLLKVEFVDRHVYSKGRRLVGKMTGPDSAIVSALASCDLQARALSRMLAAASRRGDPQPDRQTRRRPT
jgi:hypothetical protein